MLPIICQGHQYHLITEKDRNGHWQSAYNFADIRVTLLVFINPDPSIHYILLPVKIQTFDFFHNY